MTEPRHFLLAGIWDADVVVLVPQTSVSSIQSPCPFHLQKPCAYLAKRTAGFEHARSYRFPDLRPLRGSTRACPSGGKYLNVLRGVSHTESWKFSKNKSEDLREIKCSSLLSAADSFGLTTWLWLNQHGPLEN